MLEVYTRPYDPRFPQVYMDESAKQLLQDKREPLQMQPGKPTGGDWTRPPHVTRQDAPGWFTRCGYLRKHKPLARLGKIEHEALARM